MAKATKGKTRGMLCPPKHWRRRVTLLHIDIVCLKLYYLKKSLKIGGVVYGMHQMVIYNINPGIIWIWL